VRTVDLAIYADTLAAEAAAVAARIERARSRLRESAIEHEARRELAGGTIDRLERLGLLRPADEARLSTELRRLEADLEALQELQAWVEERIAG
jgi:hypothetical protein